MVEVIVASVLMASMAAIFLSGLAAINKQRLNLREESMMLIELKNVAAKSQVVDADLLELSEWFQKRYPEATLTVSNVDASIEFQPTDPKASSRPITSLPNAIRLTITMPSASTGMPIKRSLVVWPDSPKAEGAVE